MNRITVDNPMRGKGNMIVGVLVFAVGIVVAMESANALVGKALIAAGAVLFMLGKAQNWYYN